MIEFINLDTIAATITYGGFLLSLLFAAFGSRQQQQTVHLLWAITFLLAHIADKI